MLCWLAALGALLLACPTAAAAFRRDPALQIVDASVVKQFGTSCETPPDAVVHYQGDDPEDGPIT
jgi:Protein of unknown function (DUF3182)